LSVFLSFPQSCESCENIFRKENVMALIRRPTTASARLHPVELRYAVPFCFALLTAACGLASFAFACATPFAAFAVIAAAMLTLRSALLVVTGAWLINQGIGFCLLHYPVDTNTIFWGFAIGLAAAAATLLSTIVLRVLRRGGTPVALAVALLAAYGAYELVLFAATQFLGGAGNFAPVIVARLGLLSALWLIGLVVVCEFTRQLNLIRRGHAVS
jgi:hypothetical protein